MKKGGYYTVHMEQENGQKLPYIVFALSEFQAARKVREETGYMPKDHQIEGPYQRI